MSLVLGRALAMTFGVSCCVVWFLASESLPAPGSSGQWAAVRYEWTIRGHSQQKLPYVSRAICLALNPRSVRKLYDRSTMHMNMGRNFPLKATAVCA